jgi:Cu(I)/Ag(I) efflux system membrane fusion protein
MDASNPNEYYTCSMDPQVVEYKPGNCPICKMPLTKVIKAQGLKADELMISEQQVKLGNIKTGKVVYQNISDEKSITAIVKINEELSTSISVKVMGRIDKLYFKTKNEYVNKGDKLFELYSEELNLAKQEYLLLKDKKNQVKSDLIDYEQLLISAKNKLLLYGLTEQQISKLKDSDITTTTFYSATSGYVSEIKVNEGQYVMLGQEVMKLVDLSSVWIEAQAFNNEIGDIKTGQKVTILFPDFSEYNQSAEVDFINPVSKSNTRLTQFRVTLSNKNNNLKPGMIAYIDLQKTSKKVLVLPADAVLRNKNEAWVWLETGKTKFKTVMVQIGIESNGMLEITSGIKENDVVVTSGAYLLNSEYIFKKGLNPMEGHDMSKM